MGVGIEYKVEYMGCDGRDVYEKSFVTTDIDECLRIAERNLDRETDRIVSICEVMV